MVVCIRKIIYFKWNNWITRKYSRFNFVLVLVYTHTYLVKNICKKSFPIMNFILHFDPHERTKEKEFYMYFSIFILPFTQRNKNPIGTKYWQREMLPISTGETFKWNRHFGFWFSSHESSSSTWIRESFPEISRNISKIKLHVQTSRYTTLYTVFMYLYLYYNIRPAHTVYLSHLLFIINYFVFVCVQVNCFNCSTVEI